MNHCEVVPQSVVSGDKVSGGFFRTETDCPRCLKEFVPLVSLQTGRRRRPRRGESSCCWMSWSYWSTNETRWSGTWTPRRNSKLPTILQHQTETHFSPTQLVFPPSLGASAACLYTSRVKTHCGAGGVPAGLQSSCTCGGGCSTPAWAGSLPDWRRRSPAWCQAGERSELGPWR